MLSIEVHFTIYLFIARFPSRTTCRVNMSASCQNDVFSGAVASSRGGIAGSSMICSAKTGVIVGVQVIYGEDVALLL